MAVGGEMSEKLVNQRIRDRCPACGGPDLFVGTGGYLTCSLIGCPDPTAAHKLLSGRTPPPEPGEAARRWARKITQMLKAGKWMQGDIERMLQQAIDESRGRRTPRPCPRCKAFLNWYPGEYGDWKCGGSDHPEGKCLFFDYELDMIYHRRASQQAGGEPARALLEAINCLYLEADASIADDIMEKARQAIDESRGQEWVSVEERPPEEARAVIVPGGCALRMGNEWFTFMDNPKVERIQWEVTHWQPLPSPPKDPA